MIEERYEPPSPEAMREIFRRAVAQAVRAPSVLNTQPWRFKLGDNAVEVLADPVRRLAEIDPDGRALSVACGTAAFFLRTALACESLVTSAEVCPEEARPELLVRVTVRVVEPPGDLVRALGEAIPKRASNRGAFLEMPVPDEMIERFKVGAAAENAWFMPLATESLRVRITALLMEADHWQWEDPDFRRELTAWLRADKTRALDGIPARDLGVGSSRIARLAARVIDLGEREALRDRDLVLASPLLAVIGTAGDHPEDYVHAGMALGRVLLEATDEGISASFLNPVMEVAEVRDQLARFIIENGGRGHPQVVLRMGYGPAVAPGERRPVDEVIVA